jgi:hypothetical protein
VTGDGGLVLTGHTGSADGLVTGHHGSIGSLDYWVVKLSPTGTLQWQKCLGGSVGEASFDIEVTADNGYAIGGFAASTDGDVTGNHGENDYWIVKLNPDPFVTPKISITAKPGTTICSKTKVIFAATTTNVGAAITYQWIKDTVKVGTNSPLYADSLLNNGDSVICTITVGGKTVTSNKLKITVNPVVTPSVLITTPATEVCVGVKATFTATPTNGGTTSAYQWYKNGLAVGANATTYTDSVPQSNDSVYVKLTSNAACATTNVATSNTLGLKVDSANPVIKITDNKSDTICSKTPVTFTATVTPIYLWKKDGVQVGNSTNIYKDSALKNGDYVQCFLVSSVSACNGSSSNIINSNQIHFKVNSAPAQPSTITGPVVVKTNQKNIYYSVTPVAGVTYAWTLPTGAVIDSGQGGYKIKVDWGTVGSTMSVIAINSCGSSTPRTLTVGVTSGVTMPGNDAKNIVTANGLKLYPNPAQTATTLQFTHKASAKYVVTIMDAASNVVDVKTGVSLPGVNTLTINTSRYANGVYFVTIADKENGQRTIEFVKGK